MNRPIPLFIAVGIVALSNMASFGVVYITNSNTVKANCRANDTQNKILGKLVDVSLEPTSDPRVYDRLSKREKKAVRIFREEREKLRIPACD